VFSSPVSLIIADGYAEGAPGAPIGIPTGDWNAIEHDLSAATASVRTNSVSRRTSERAVH